MTSEARRKEAYTKFGNPAVMKSFLFYISIFLFFLPSALLAADWKTKKYRQDQVDVSSNKFETLDTLKSSFVRGAWYDKSNQYLILDLGGVNYHYCGVPEKVWQQYKTSDSFGQGYHTYFKGKFDCREGKVPTY
jgi:hypothetical protein